MADPVYSAIIRVGMGLFRSLDLQFDTRGQANVPAAGGGVVVINHTGYLDFAIAGVPFWYSHRRFVRFMAKDDVFRHPIGGPLMKGMKHIPVDRGAGAAAYQAAVDALARGEFVGVFPEATISQSFRLKEFKSGAARMAMESGTPIIPLVIWGSQRVWTKGRKRRMIRDGRHTPVTISVGEPLRPANGETAEQLSGRVREVMQQLLETVQADYPQQPRDASDRWWLPEALGGSAPTPEEAWKADAAEAEAKALKRAEKQANAQVKARGRQPDRG